MSVLESFSGKRGPSKLEYSVDTDSVEIRRRAIKIMVGDLPHHTSQLSFLTGKPEDLVSFSIPAIEYRTNEFRRIETHQLFVFAMTKEEVRGLVLRDLGLPLVLKPYVTISGPSTDNLSRVLDARRSVLAQKRFNALKTGEPFYDGTIDPDNYRYKPDIVREASSVKSNKATIVVIGDEKEFSGVEQRYIGVGTVLGLKQSLETRYKTVGIESFGDKSTDPASKYALVKRKFEGIDSHVHIVHLSDGNVQKFDAKTTLKNAQALAEIAEMFGHIFVPSTSTSYSALSEVLKMGKNNKIAALSIRHKDHVRVALGKYLAAYL